MVAAPFLKWAGGKRQLLSHIEALVPERIDTYFEPFLGGAAVFFWLAARGRFTTVCAAVTRPSCRRRRARRASSISIAAATTASTG